MKNVIAVTSVGVFITLLIVGADGLKRVLKAVPHVVRAVLKMFGKI